MLLWSKQRLTDPFVGEKNQGKNNRGKITIMKIGFLGAGQMARALSSGFVHAKIIDVGDVLAFDASPVAAKEFSQLIGAVTNCATASELVENSDVLFLAVKPQHVETVARDTGPLDASKLLVSIAAGVTISRISKLFSTSRVVRVMPNTPCLIRRGACGYALGPTATGEDGALIGQLLEAVGLAFPVPEVQLNAITGLSGSGPAFVFQFVEALSDGGVAAGLPREMSTQLAAQTVLGAALMILQTGDHPGALKDRVASPAGTTMAGLRELETSGFRAAAMNAVIVATERSEELGRNG